MKSYDNLILSDRPFRYWPLSSNNLDELITGDTLTPTGTTTRDERPGPIQREPGGAVGFAGAGAMQAGTLGNWGSMFLHSGHAVEIWFRMTGGGLADQYHLGTNRSGSTFFRMHTTSSGTAIRYQVRPESPSGALWDRSFTSTDGQWHHMAWTMSQGGRVYSIADGVIVDHGNQPSFDPGLDLDRLHTIGCYNNRGALSFHMTGQLSRHALYLGTAIPPSVFVAHYHAGRHGVTYPEGSI